MASRPKKSRASFARQIKVKSKRANIDAEDEADFTFDIVECAMDIKHNTTAHRHDVDATLRACEAALEETESDEGDAREKLARLAPMYRALASRFNELLRYTVRLETATELAVTSRHQYAMQIAAGDTESASDVALMSSVHRR